MGGNNLILVERHVASNLGFSFLDASFFSFPLLPADLKLIRRKGHGLHRTRERSVLNTVFKYLYAVPLTLLSHWHFELPRGIWMTVFKLAVT